MSMYSTLRHGNLVRMQEWDPENKLSLSFHGNELAGEVGELCNVIKKIERKNLGIRGGVIDLQAAAEEIGDSVICLDIIAMKLQLPQIMTLAHDKFNLTSKKHGLNTFITKGSQ